MECEETGMLREPHAATGRVCILYKIKPGTWEVWCSILLAVPLQVQGVNYIDPTGSNIKKLDISVKFNGLEESYK